ILNKVNLLNFQNCEAILTINDPSINFCERRNKFIYEALKSLKGNSDLLTPEYAKVVFYSLRDLFGRIQGFDNGRGDGHYCLNVLRYLIWADLFKGENAANIFAVFIDLKHITYGFRRYGDGSAYLKINNIFSAIAVAHLKAQG